MRTPDSADYKSRMKPLAHLNEAEANIWRALVRSVGSDHFQACDQPLLTEYCRAAALADKAAEALQEGAVIDRKASPRGTVQEKSVRALVALSARLRLCPQSRFDRLKAGTTSRTGMPGRHAEDDALLAGPTTGLASFRK
jgi:phage terminase small subunit